MEKMFTGVYPAVVTPFNSDGSYDFAAARKHIDWLIDNGIKGLCLMCAAGEYQSVSMEEHMAYVSEMVPYARDRASVMVGATRERPEDVVALMRHAKTCGAHAAMVLPAFYYHMPQDEIVKHYAFIGDNVDLPIMVYNSPGSCGVLIEGETIDKLCALKNVRIVKETSCDMGNVTDTTGRVPAHVSVMCGCENLLFESYAVGTCGWVSLVANFLPKLALEFHHAMYEDRDYAKGLAIHRKLLPVMTFLENYPKTVQAAKYIVTAFAGIDVGKVRRPRYELSEAEKAYVVEKTRIKTLF